MTMIMMAMMMVRMMMMMMLNGPLTNKPQITLQIQLKTNDLFEKKLKQICSYNDQSPAVQETEPKSAEKQITSQRFNWRAKDNWMMVLSK